MDTPTQRIIKIGNGSIGLVDFDIAINSAFNKKLTTNEAINYVFSKIENSNYIPTGMEDKYRSAIKREYNKLQGLISEDTTELKIRILGPGCVSCNALLDKVINAMMKAEIAADIEQIHDRDEIGRYGVIATPALMINEKIMIAGIQPTVAQIEEWIKNA